MDHAELQRQEHSRHQGSEQAHEPTSKPTSKPTSEHRRHEPQGGSCKPSSTLGLRADNLKWLREEARRVGVSPEIVLNGLVSQRRAQILNKQEQRAKQAQRDKQKEGKT